MDIQHIYIEKIWGLKRMHLTLEVFFFLLIEISRTIIIILENYL